MAFLGDLIVKMGADINPFQSAMKKAQSVTHALKSSLTDMRTTAGVFAKLAASIKATNNQMDRLVHVSKGALSATQSLSAAELSQSRLRLQQLKMIQQQQQHNAKMQMMQAGGGGGSMIGAGIAGGIAGSLANGVTGALSSGVGAITDMGIGAVNLAANAEVMRIEFETLLGDVTKGTKMFGELEKFALRTSFDLTSAADAARGMLATGVKENELIGTMQLIGDLAMGDAMKLQLVSKAYTDVLSKGKLQAQELRQFAENGINIRQALMDLLGKTSGEITAMSEAGEISFGVMQEALISLTAEGGRFHDSMEKRNATFRGQWDALTETVQGFGRDLGALVLPALKDIVSEANKFAQAFRAMDDKPKFLADLLDATLSVAFESIKENWDLMLGEMILKAKVAGFEIQKNLNPLNAVGEAIGGAAGRMVDGPKNMAPGQSPLDAAKANLADVMKQLEGPASKQQEQAKLDAMYKEILPFVDGKTGEIKSKDPMENRRVQDLINNWHGQREKVRAMPDVASGDPFDALKPQPQAANGSKLKDLAGGLAESAQGLFSQVATAAQSKLTDLKIKGGYLGSVVGNMFGVGDKSKVDESVKPNLRQTNTAGAMQKGSAEAFSTIVKAMMATGKDPNVKATEKQTKTIVAELKKNRPPKFAYVASFEGGGGFN